MWHERELEIQILSGERRQESSPMASTKCGNIGMSKDALLQFIRARYEAEEAAQRLSFGRT